MRSFVPKAFVLALITVFALPYSVFADTLFLSPLEGTYSVGQTFSIRVMATSPRQAVNAISGTVSFPADKIQVTSVSKIGSILSLWVQEPSFSNSRGTVTFEGVVPNPGFSESQGRVLAINFRVVGTGPATVRVSSGTMLANDGYGTNVLKTLGTASFTLEQRQELPPTPPAISETQPEDDVPAEPVATPTFEPEVEDKKVEIPTVASVSDMLLKFLSIVIPLVALIFLLTHTAIKGAGNVGIIRKRMRKDLHEIDNLVEKSFDLIKEDISESIDILERARTKRKLTAEEDAIVHRLRQNLVDAEKIIRKEIHSAEKDIDE